MGICETPQLTLIGSINLTCGHFRLSFRTFGAFRQQIIESRHKCWCKQTRFGPFGVRNHTNGQEAKANLFQFTNVLSNQIVPALGEVLCHFRQKANEVVSRTFEWREKSMRRRENFSTLYATRVFSLCANKNMNELALD